MKLILSVLLLATALPAHASKEKGTHVFRADLITGRAGPAASADPLALPGDITRIDPASFSDGILFINPADFSDVFAHQEQLQAARAAVAANNPEIAANTELHDALRANAPVTTRGLSPASLPRAGNVDFDGTGSRATGEPEARQRKEIPGFYDLLGRARHEGIYKKYVAGKGVQVDERILEEDGHQVVVQDISGWWPQEFFMTRTFFFRKDAQGKVIAAVKTDGEGNLSDGRPEDFEAELQWWRRRGKKRI